MNFTLLQVYQGYPIKNNYLTTWRHPHFLFLSFSTEPTKINGVHIFTFCLFLHPPLVVRERGGGRVAGNEKEKYRKLVARKKSFLYLDMPHNCFGSGDKLGS